MSLVAEERILQSSPKQCLLKNLVCPSKGKTSLPPNTMSQNNVSTLHKCFKTATVEQTKKSIQGRGLLPFSLHAK